MDIEVPVGLNVKEVKRLLGIARAARHVGERMDLISNELLGRPYAANPLGGGPDEDEVFTAALESFDCVTFIETVLALARSKTVGGFIEALRLIRYRNGDVVWARRNHYMASWARNNCRAGIVYDVTRGPLVIERKRTLSMVEGVRRRTLTISCFPKPLLLLLAPAIRSGDIFMFVSVRRSLDVFHTGLVFREGRELVMRHATRTEGAVVEQPLSHFMENNRMEGFTLLRPLDPIAPTKRRDTGKKKASRRAVRGNNRS